MFEVSRMYENSKSVFMSEKKVITVLFYLSLSMSILIYALISLGGLVRGAGAGLSCPDWPLCYGQVLPEQMLNNGSVHAAPAQIFLEWFHRLIAGGVSIIMLTVSTIVFANKKLRQDFGKFCILGLAFLAFQVVLGGLTVLGLLSPKWVSSHLVVGLAFFLTMVSMTLHLNYKRIGIDLLKANRKFSTFAISALAVIYFQIFLGGLVSSNFAALACLDFPTCNGQWLPELSGGVKFQFLHRVGALVTLITVIGYLLNERKTFKSKLSKKISMTIPLLLSVQILLGVGMIFMHLPLLMAVAHLAVATALLGLMQVMVHEGKYSN